MDALTLYHGSPCIVQEPSLAAGKPNNDYGRGFYCTTQLPLAKEWACKAGHDGFANRFTLETHGLATLDLLDGTHSVLEWIALLLANRTFDLETQLAVDTRAYLVDHFLPSLAGTDLVIGYRADDSYFAFAEEFVSGALPLRALNRALHLGNLGEQVALVSERAFGQLSFVDAEPAEASTFFPRFKARDEAARRQWRDDIRGSSTYRDDLYALDILREEVTANDPRVRRILSARR